MTTPVTEKLAENHMKYVKVPANLTNLFQPLDLTINRSAKAFMKKKFTEWYSLEVMKQLDIGKNVEEIEVKLLLSNLIPLHASWLIELLNHFTSTAGKETIANRWKAAGITDDIKSGSSSLDLLDPFSTIDPFEQQADDEIFGRQRTYPTESSTNFESNDEENGSLNIPWPKIDIFLIFSMMNKNVHLTRLFYVRQNCETALSI